MKIIVLIPIYKVKFRRLKKIVKYLNKKVFQIICIDDCCPFKTGKKLEKLNLKKLKIIYNQKNLGVGGAMKEGFKFIKKINYDYAVKIDGDGQLNPNDALNMCKYAYNNKIDYTIGTRFDKKKGNKKNMPKIRWYGNIILSFFSRIASAQYQIQDFLNGMICISSKNLQKINLKNIKDNFLFETSMIYENTRNNNSTDNFPINVKYFKENSNFNPSKEIIKFILFNTKKFFKRIYTFYFLKKIKLNSFIILINIFCLIFFLKHLIFFSSAKYVLILFIINIKLFFLFIINEFSVNN